MKSKLMMPQTTLCIMRLQKMIDYEDARDIIAEKYPNRKVIAVQEKYKVK